MMVFAIHQYESAIGIHVSLPSWTSLLPPPHPSPPACHRAPALCTPCYTSNSHWLSVLHMLMYMFWCHSLNSSYPLLPPLWPQVCSPYLRHLHRCPAHRFISIISLDPCKMCVLLWVMIQKVEPLYLPRSRLPLWTYSIGLPGGIYYLFLWGDKERSLETNLSQFLKYFSILQSPWSNSKSQVLIEIKLQWPGLFLKSN